MTFAQTNLSRLEGTVATASGYEGDYAPANAIDGNTGTRWGSNFENNTDTEWFQIEWTSAQTFNTVRLLCENAMNATNAPELAFDIQTSNDGSNWTTQSQVTGKNAGNNEYITVKLNEVTAKFVRFQGVKKGNYGYTFFEFEVYNIASQVLTSLEVSPSLVQVGKATQMTFTAKDQIGAALTEGVTYQATNATLNGTTLTATSVGNVTITATYNTVSVEKTIKATNVSDPTTNPTEPTDLTANVIAVYSAKYNKGIIDSNSGWGNGGAPNPFYKTVEEVEIAEGHKVVHVKGAGFNSRPAQEPDNTVYDKIHVALYPFTATTAKIFSDNAYGDAIVVDDLVPGQWNYVEVENTLAKANYYLVELVGEEEFYLDHFYFSKPAVDDSLAPTLDVAEVVSSGIGIITLKLKATDDKSTQITYVINDGTNDYITKGNSGAEITYIVRGLEFGKAYTLSITAQDDNENASSARQVQATTATLTAAPAPTEDEDNVYSLLSDAYTNNNGFKYAQWWDGQAKFEELTIDNNKVWHISNFVFIGSEHAEVDASGFGKLHMDILPVGENQTLGVCPIGTDNKCVNTLELTANQWNSVDISIADLIAAGQTLTSVKQLKLTGKDGVNGNGEQEFYIDNIYYVKTTGPVTKTVTFVKPVDWGNTINVWAWNETTGENFTGGSWPGVAATNNNDGTYSWSTTGDPEYIIFNDGTNQTKNLQFVAGTTYTIEGLEFTATFKNSIGWENVYAYAYTDGTPAKEYLGGWPGTAMTLNNGVYTISFKASEAPANIIFNNGSGGKGNQTENLVFEDGKEYDVVPEQPTSGEESYIIESGTNEGKELKYTWEFIQEGMDVTVTFAVTGTDEIVGLVDGAVIDRSVDPAVNHDGLTYTWTNCTEGQEIKAAHFWAFATGAYTTPDFTYTVKSAQPIRNTYTATFKNSIGWDNVYAYTYGPETLGKWPGTQLETVNDVLTISFKAAAAPTNIIFNNGSGGKGNQTEDLVFVDGKEYDMILAISAPDKQDIVKVTGEITDENKGQVESLTDEMIDLSGATITASSVEITGNPNAVVVVAGTVETAASSRRAANDAITTQTAVKGNRVVKRGDYYFPVEQLKFIDDPKNGLWTGSFISGNNAGWKYTRTLKANTYNTVVVPIGTTVPEGATAYEFSAYDNGTVTFTELEGDMAAATPYLVKVGATDVVIEIKSTDDFNIIEANAKATVKDGATFKANYKKQNMSDVYVLETGTTTATFKKAADANIGSCRAYLTGVAPAAAGSQELTIVLSGETTEIGTIKADGTIDMENTEIYDLSGRRVKNPAKGIYIVNGKKIILK